MFLFEDQNIEHRPVLLLLLAIVGTCYLPEHGCSTLDTSMTEGAASKFNKTTVSLSHQVRTAFKVPNLNVDKKQLHAPDELLEKPSVNILEPAILSPTDMPGDMLTFATETAIKAVTSFSSVADMAEYLRMKFEARFPSTTTGNWQTSVGTSFASSIRKRTGTGFYAKLKNTYFLIFASP